MQRISFIGSSTWLVGMLLMAAVLLGGCGDTASAAEATSVAQEATPAARQAAVLAANPAADPAADSHVEGASRADSLPALPNKAPVFHQQDAKRILPSRMTIPAIKVDTPVVELGWTTSKTASGTIFSEWDVAEYAAGWHKNSAVPSEAGNVVMSGHNNILGSVFRELDQLKRGDKINVFSGGTQYTYVVDEVLILPEKHASAKQRSANVKYIEETPDDRLTLVSCWPRDDNTHRIVVIARPQVLSTNSAGASGGN